MPQHILITGANRGIGLEMTRQALARGDMVIAACRQPDAASDLQTLATAHAGQLQIIAMDVRDEDAVKAAAAQTATLLDDQKIDILVCNAGTLNARGGLTDAGHTPDNIQDSLLTNIAGVFYTARHFSAMMPDHAPKPARVAVISSQMGSSARSGTMAPIYRATKAAATNLARSMALELAPRGIAVGAYHPGWVQTDMGGADAAITVEVSAAGLLQRFEALDMTTSGLFETYAGEPLPF